MAARQTIPPRHHSTQKTKLCARNTEQAQNVSHIPAVSDETGREASSATQNLLQIGHMMGTAISTVSYEHEKLKSEIVKKHRKESDKVSQNGIYMVLTLIFLIFIADIFFAYF